MATNLVHIENDSDIKDLQDAARIIGQRLAIVNASADNELVSAFESAVRQQAKSFSIIDATRLSPLQHAMPYRLYIFTTKPLGRAGS